MLQNIFSRNVQMKHISNSIISRWKTTFLTSVFFVRTSVFLEFSPHGTTLTALIGMFEDVRWVGFLPPLFYRWDRRALTIELIQQEILELCEVIYMNGYSLDESEIDEETAAFAVIKFGDLFKMYTRCRCQKTSFSRHCLGVCRVKPCSVKSNIC